MGVTFIKNYESSRVAKAHRIYPYFKNGRFFNYPGERQESIIRSGFMLLESLLHKTQCIKSFKRQWVVQQPLFVHDQQRTKLYPLITWIGHATFIIQVAGLTIATDPIFGNPSSLFKRITQPGIALEQLPAVDVVLISHNHLDHMHTASLRSITKKNPQVKIFVPLGDKAWFDKNGFAHVQECTWWDAIDIAGSSGDSVRFSFLPAVHWSGRGIFDRNRSLWGSWMIQTKEHSTYFAGDSAYGRHFKVIAQEFGQIDTALLPIGPCEPKEDQELTHMGPEQAGQAFCDLGAQQFIPMHWGVYHFGIDHPLLPMERLQAWWNAHVNQLQARVLSPLKFGETIECKRQIIKNRYYENQARFY
jgi:L-ascorbate metabolism protein UlaG (beta-lactamase superfamily)